MQISDFPEALIIWPVGKTEHDFSYNCKPEKLTEIYLCIGFNSWNEEILPVVFSVGF